MGRIIADVVAGIRLGHPYRQGWQSRGRFIEANGFHGDNMKEKRSYVYMRSHFVLYKDWRI